MNRIKMDLIGVRFCIGFHGFSTEQNFFFLGGGMKKAAVVGSLWGGVREIRTPESLLTITRFPGVPLQPLEHHSICACALGNAKLQLRHKCECKDSEFLLDCSKNSVNL